MDIITDLSCSRTPDPDMALSSSSDPDITTAPGGSTGHPDQCGPGGTMALRQQYGHRLWLRPQASMWPLVATRARDINMDLTMVGPWTHTWSSAAVQDQMSPWLQVAVQATRIDMAPAA